MAKVRKSKGRILTLKNENGDWITSPDELKRIATDHFRNIFQTTHFSSPNLVVKLNHIHVTEEEGQLLVSQVSMEEVKD